MAFGTSTRAPWWTWAWPLLAWLVIGLQLVVPGNIVVTG